MINNLINSSPLCGCKQPPRVITQGYAVCRCANLVYTPSRPYAGPAGPTIPSCTTPWDRWQADLNPALRAQLISDAKRRVHHVEVVDPDAVRDAVAAARQVNDHTLANDLEYEQWVASL